MSRIAIVILIYVSGAVTKFEIEDFPDDKHKRNSGWEAWNYDFSDIQNSRGGEEGVPVS
jgi:hypothetical protein